MALDIGALQTNATDIGALQTTFIPTPTIVVSPTSGAQNSVLTLTVTGTNTNFVSGTTAVGFSGTGITVGTITVLSLTSLTVSVLITLTAATGVRTLTTTTGTEAPSTTFTVNPATTAQRGNIDYDQVQVAVRQGVGAQFQMFGGGTTTTGHLAVYDVGGSVIDGGSAPATGTASIKVNGVLRG